MKVFGVDGKWRFTIKYPDGKIAQYGTCDPKEDERMSIQMTVSPFGSGYEIKQYWLVRHQKDSYDSPEKERILLPDGTLIANGYYSHEWDEFVSPDVWLNEAMDSGVWDGHYRV